MSKTLTLGPNGTDVPTIGTIDMAIEPLHFDADFRIVDEGPGRVIYADMTAPVDQPWTLRVAQTRRANIYSGTSIDPSAYASMKQGLDTIVEVRGVGKSVDSVSGAEELLPFRAAISTTLPIHETVTKSVVETLLKRLIASIALMGEDGVQNGLDAHLHGSVKK